MEKNTNAYTQQHGVSLAFAKDFKSFAIVAGRFFGSFFNYKNWEAIAEVPGTLVVSVIPDNTGGNTVYNVSAKFRVSYSGLSNKSLLEKYTKDGVILKYTSGGRQERIAGTKENFLTLTISEPEGFDGYECTLVGMQNCPQSFV
jgi:hypothetical protein